MMTFKEYLVDHRAGFNAQGDFVRLANADANLPDVATWSEMRTYMEGRRDSPDAIEAGQEVWAAYQAVMRRAGNA